MFRWNNYRVITYIFVIGGVILFYLSANLFANLVPAGLVHFPVRNAVEGENISLEAKVEDPNVEVEYMRIYFRIKGQVDYQYIEMDRQLDSFTGEIPSTAVRTPGVEYFILALMVDKSMATSPASNPFYAPHEVVVTPKAQKEDKIVPPIPAPIPEETTTSLVTIDVQVTVLSPTPEETIEQQDVVIAVSFLGETEKIDLKSIRLLLDGKDQTTQADISENLISYVPEKLSTGTHDVKIEVSDIDGNRLNDVSWKFFVSEKIKAVQSTQRKLPFSGKIFAETRNEKVVDSTLVTNNFGGNIRGKFGALRYHGMIFITSREKPEFQPRNRFLLEVGTSWIGVKLGDTSPRFNELVLWGRRVRGVEAYLKLGFFNIEFVQGQTNRKIEGISYHDIYLPVANDSSKFINAATGDTVISTTGIYRYGTYQQNLLAIRPSIGSGKHFQLGLNLVKVKDDPKSIQYSNQPKDNVVLGPDLLLAFDDHRIELKLSAAFSLLANDITDGAISKAEFDTTIGDFPFDPADYEDYFIINTSLIPLDPTQMTSLAYLGSFKFNYFNNNITAIYKSIGSEYNSLANSFLRKDIQGFSIYDRVRLFKNQVYLNLGYEKYLEGFSSRDDGDVTTAPNDYSAFNFGISYYPRNLYLPKVNVNWKHYDRDNGLDTTVTASAVNYQNKDLSVQLSYDVELLGWMHQISISHITNDRIDGFGRTGSDLANTIQMFTLRTNYQIPLTTVISYAKNNNMVGEGLNGFRYNMFNVSAIYKLLNGKLLLKTGFNTTNAVGSYTTYVDSLGNPLTDPVELNYTDYKRTAFNIGGRFTFMKKHQLLWDLNFIDFNDKVTGAYKNRLIRFRYQMQY